MHNENFDFPPKSNRLAISSDELWILSYYAASELTGGLLMGRMARVTKNDELRSRLIWHSAEETRHATRWVEVIRKLGGDPLKINQTYQSNYFTRIGVPEDEIDLFIITQVFELRVARHFTIHRQLKPNPIIDTMLATMIADEAEHIRWVREKLDELSKNDQKMATKIKQKMVQFKQIDQEVYLEEAKKFEKRGWKVPPESKEIKLAINY